MRNKRKILLFAAAVSAMIFAQGQSILAAETASTEFSDSADADLFSDGTDSTGSMTALAQDLVKQSEEQAEKYKEEQEEAEKLREERRVEKALKASEKADQEKQAAIEEIQKTVEEAKAKAEEARLAKRQEIVNYALQFEGNPYVYGGTSLTNGADCSGFVMSVFANFGYSLPRVAAAQYEACVQKDESQLEPGDLIFYGDSGIDHVALYIGDGKIIHASTAATGIKISDYNYRQPTGIGTCLE